MATKLNQNSINFDELTNKWSSGENVYGSGCQLTDTSPQQIYKLAFDHTIAGKKFFDELIKNNPSSSSSPSSDTTYKLLPWVNKPTSKPYTSIKQRKINIKSTESGIAFFLRKNITTNITQTAFFDPSQECISIYSVARTRTETKQSDHYIIDRWTIKISDKDPKCVFISINANILWDSTSLSPAATIIKSKWLRFYQSRFETWRSLVKKYIDEDNAKLAKNKLMEPYLGVWNKLKSFHTIKIMPNMIEYSDGSQFDVNINPDTNEIIATYASSTFTGKLIKNIDYESIEWNNGSIWIRDGFQRFEGEYIHKSTQQRYIISKLGTIKLPITGRNLRFQLLTKDRISYKFNRNIIHKGTMNEDGDIKWDNGSYWENKSRPAAITISKHRNGAKTVDVPLFKKEIEREEIVKTMQNKERTEHPKETEDTTKVEGEIEEKQEQEDNDVDDEFEQDFDAYFKNEDNLSIEIKNDAHFVLIDDDELFNTKTDRKSDNSNADKVDEWLLV